ncbi:hypothetical protein BJ742DRAFT_785925 [Cladochytrium replicatum]|nr:hypothetical protein BJ742DRAFT_785925 [Cladochytrium replicatum]
MPGSRIFSLPQSPSDLPEAIQTPPYSQFRKNPEQNVIVIDNGSQRCRAGWASLESPSLNFPNMVAKYRERKTNVPFVLVGHDIASAGQFQNAKSAMESGMVVSSELMEYVFDYIFLKLGLDGDRIQHPVVLTEPLINTGYSRRITSELMFESYGVQELTYGVDSLFSYYANMGSLAEPGIVVSGGNYSTTVIPVSDGRGWTEHAKRLSYGGYQMSEYLLKLVQHKYPSFPHKVTPKQAETLTHRHVRFSLDYQAELREMATDPWKLDEKTHVIQFPFTPLNERAVEDLQVREQRKAANAKRLQEMAAQQREKKIQQKEELLGELRTLKEERTLMTKTQFTERLKTMGLQTEAELDKTVKETEDSIRQSRNRQLGIQEPPEDKEKPVLDLLDIPDDKLTEEQIKTKRRQRIMKSAWEFRERIRKEKEEGRAREEELQRKDAEERARDPQKWLEKVRRKRKVIVDKIRTKLRRKTQLADRRSAESKQRMRNIAALASEDLGVKRRRKGQDDTFGANDDDWSVYREISKADDSEEDEQTAMDLANLDELLSRHDPHFVYEDVYADDSGNFTNTILHRLAHGGGHRTTIAFSSNDDDRPTPPTYDFENPEHVSQLHLNVERIRVPEVIFQPTIVGLDQAGLVEVIADMLKQRGHGSAQRILVTGGLSRIPFFRERLNQDLRAVLPVNTAINVRAATDPLLDPWKGAAKWVRDNGGGWGIRKMCFTKQQYEEWGGDYLQEHSFGNCWYGKSPMLP